MSKQYPEIHVTFHNRDEEGLRWYVKKEGINPSSRFRTKKEAVDSARILARELGSELVIHNRDGKIALKDSHGRDSRKSKG